jgi:hypothetical protein
VRLCDQTKSSQYAEAASKHNDLQSKPIKLIGMARYTSLNPNHGMKTSKYLPVIMFVSAIWILLDVKSPAQGFKLEPAQPQPLLVPSPHSRHRLLAQNIESSSTNPDANKDFQLQDVRIIRNTADKSLLTVKGSINNRSDQSRYVYYIVAKFIANDVAIKQTIIPVNIGLEPGQSKAFTHEISTEKIDSISPETVKSLVVKYEYR